jgi:iron complex transport system ATP-binding protein
VLGTIAALADEGVAVLMTTHVPDHAILMDARAGILDTDGRLTSGSADEIITQENLMRIYQADVVMAFIPEVNHRVCAARRIR